MKIAEIRQKSTDELKAQVKKIHEEHFNLRFRRVTDVIENPQALRELRRDLARIHTIVRQREMDEAKKTPVPAKAAEKSPAPEKAPAPVKAEGKKKAAAPKGEKKGK